MSVFDVTFCLIDMAGYDLQALNAVVVPFPGKVQQAMKLYGLLLLYSLALTCVALGIYIAVAGDLV